MRSCLGVALVLVLSGRAAAQVPLAVQQFHDQAAAAIAQMANRPLTPGDTFLTWNPEPGGLIHTVHATAAGVSSSLLRGDGMIGSAETSWAGGAPARFRVLWTRPDSGGAGVDSATVVVGERTDGILRVLTRGASHEFRVPEGPWAVADFGMEEQLIPLLRALPAGAGPIHVQVLRPYHVRWDTLQVTVRDTAGLRTVDVQGADKAHELMVIDASGALLWSFRFDQPGERRPLEGSARYAEYLEHRAALGALTRASWRP